MDIIKYLNNKVEEEYNKKENEHKHITYIRKKVLEEAKNNGLIKDYKYTKNITKNGLFFGSCVGYDAMYKIIV